MPLEFDKLAPINRCGAALISAAGLVERLALQALGRGVDKRTFSSWDEVLRHIDDHIEPFRSGRKVRRYSEFLSVHNQIPLTRRNPESFGRLEKAVMAALGAYLTETSPIILAAAPDDIAPTPETEFLALAARVFNDLTETGLTMLVDNVRPANFENHIVERISAELFAQAEVPYHPLYSCLRLLDPLLVKSELLHVTDAAAQSGGDYRQHIAGGSYRTYAVLREARGWSARDPADINFIVRDLLWIRASAKIFVEYTSNDATNKNLPIGFYVSAVDNECFYIDRIELQGNNNIILTARSAQMTDTAHRIMLIFAASAQTHELQLRDGILSGFAEEGRNLAAWKALLIRPNWDFGSQLETLLDQITIDELHRAYEICNDASVVGVFFSEEARKALPGLQIRREIFRRMVVADTEIPSHPRASFGEFVTREIRETAMESIGEELKALGDLRELPEAAIPEVFGDLMLNATLKFTQNKWHLIEPAQIIMFRQHDVTRSLNEMSQDRRQEVVQLLDVSNITRTRDGRSGRHS